jgi:Ca2+-binding EF-hand superfamily protein
MFGRGGGPPFGGGPEDFLRRLDENNNGQIDPEESQGRASFFLQRMAGDIPGLDLSRPISIQRLSEALTRMREQRMRESGGDSRGGGSRGSSASSESEPLVPGFGVEDILPAPPGFGTAGELFSVSITNEDRREAEERFQRYDRNRDGFLDRGEISQGRWRDDPFVYDRNHDGKLTPSEMAVRYAQRRLAEEGSSRGGSSASRSDATASRGGSSGGDSRMETMMRAIFDRYDRNRSGVLERDEWGSFRSDPSGADTNKDNRISREEMSAYMQDRFRGGRGDRGDRSDDSGDRRYYAERDGGGGSGDDRDSGKGDDTRQWYRFKTLQERLPEGLPEWFARNDTDADGQVAMAEFAVSWSDSVIADYAKFDLNRDGLITPRECLAAVANGAVRGSTAGPSSPPGPTSTSSPPSSGGARPASPAASSAPAPASTAGISDKYLKYATGLVNRYDTNKDGMLTANEWKDMSLDVAPADKDGSGQVTINELAEFMQR